MNIDRTALKAQLRRMAREKEIRADERRIIREEVEKVENPYGHKTKVIHDDSKCICSPLSAPCARDFCFSQNHIFICPCDTVECKTDCPSCAFESCRSRILKALEGK